MDSKALIDSYTDDVARRLPRESRNDVGLELRALLTEQLKTVAEGAGRAPDREMALRVLSNFGRPEEVAARYRPRGFHLIEPEHAPAFVKLALTVVAIQWALTLPRVFSSAQTFGEWWLGWGLGAFWWVGLFAVWFACAAWIRRRSPVDPHGFARPWTHWILWLPLVEDWRPRDGQSAGQTAAVVLISLSALLTIFFAAPSWFLEHSLSASVDTSWAEYDVGFRRWLLIPLLTLMTTRLCLFAAVTIHDRLRAHTEVVRLAIWVCFVALLYWSMFAWDIFASVGADFVFKAWLLVFLLINTLQIGLQIRGVLTRVRVPKTLAKREPNDF